MRLLREERENSAVFLNNINYSIDLILFSKSYTDTLRISNVLNLRMDDSDFIRNSYLNQFPGNKDLIMNAINWTLGQSKSITIRPKDAVSHPLKISAGAMNFIKYFSTVIMPLFIIIIGISVYLRRRKNG